MPLYMDVHKKVEGLTAEAVAGAHQRDLEVGKGHGVHYLRYRRRMIGRNWEVRE